MYVQYTQRKHSDPLYCQLTRVWRMFWHKQAHPGPIGWQGHLHCQLQSTWAMDAPKTKDSHHWETGIAHCTAWQTSLGNLHSSFTCLNPFTPSRMTMSNFHCGLTRNITPHSMEKVAFHSLLRWEMIILPILTTSLIHFSLGKLGECTFWTLSESVRARLHMQFFDAISDAISRTKYVLPYTNAFLEKYRVDWKESYHRNPPFQFLLTQWYFVAALRG